MEQAVTANRAHFRPYTVTRNYRFFGDESDKPSSEVIARVNFVPPARKDFTIDRVQGNERGEKVVRRILTKETEMAAQSDSTDVTRENYDFEYQGVTSLDGRRCYVVRLKPKRKEQNLLQGIAWVDTQTYLIHRIQGKPGKSPSWWLKDLNLTFTFGEVRGMWLQKGSEAVADVRLFGRHTVIARAISYETGEIVAARTPRASAAPPLNIPARRQELRRPSHRAPQVMVGAGVLIDK